MFCNKIFLSKILIILITLSFKTHTVFSLRKVPGAVHPRNAPLKKAIPLYKVCFSRGNASAHAHAHTHLRVLLMVRIVRSLEPPCSPPGASKELQGGYPAVLAPELRERSAAPGSPRPRSGKGGDKSAWP